jgi:hypothetical protein
VDDFGGYLARINWGLAVLAAVVGVAVAAVARRFILAVAEDILRALPGLADLLGRRAIGRLPESDAAPWFCAVCHSQNPPSAGACYRGCGARADRDRGTPRGEEPAGPSGGRSTRRG